MYNDTYDDNKSNDMFPSEHNDSQIETIIDTIIEKTDMIKKVESVNTWS